MAVEKEPAVAAKIFGDRIELARAYAAALARDSDTLGLLGPRELEIIWSRHILNSAVVAELVADGKTVADVDLFELNEAFAAVGWHFGATIETLYGCIVVAFLVAMSGIDFDTQYLPDSLTLPLLWLFA